MAKAQPQPQPYTPIPARIPATVKGTIKSFRTLGRFSEYYDSIVPTGERIPDSGTTTYDELYRWLINRLGQDLNNETWYGDPLPATVQDGLDRTKYQRMEEFNDVYKRVIQPRIQDILNISRANLEMPTLKYNDRGLGIFDFNKASTGLIPIYKYYSFKKKEFVEGTDCKVVKDGKKVKYALKSDGSPVVIVPRIKGYKNNGKHDKDYEVEKVHKAYKEIYDGGKVFEVLKKFGLKIGGQNSIGSTIKKVYVQKEKIAKPKNAVRIFVNLGANCDVTAEQLKWSGYLAIGIALLMGTLGYSVSVTAVYGCNSNINTGGAALERGTRFIGINLKNFEETLDAASLLYVCSDATFFRMKIFEVIVKNAFVYKDYMGHGLGSTAELSKTREIIFNEYGKRDGLFNPKGELNEKSEFLYYIIGEVRSEADMNSAILEIKEDIVNQNKVAKEKLLGLW